MSDSTSALEVPPTPTTPATPQSPGPGQKSKKANPLNDLIDTEKAYVDNLTGIIRKVAGAWSRSNLPPPELDSMFRSVEGVYKANRGLHGKLKEIGANPSSPKALGDLLMQWIDDLEAPYSTYCAKYRGGFDTWPPVQSNPKLGSVLEAFSATSPPSGGPDGQLWTLDSLFLLPRARLKYYRKLYSRLLKSTAPGRSDHRLLVSAVETLDRLLETLDSRATILVSSTVPPPAVETEDEVVVDMRARSMSPPAPVPNNPPMRISEALSNPGSESGSTRGSVTSGERLSRETANTSISRGSNATLSMPISNLERRLCTDRTLDIFTMTPKVVKLQMLPPGLTFTRELRISADVVIRFVPRATNVEVVHRFGHIYLLSDLFLVCDRMTPEEQAQNGNEGADMWLSYPPLAGKVLRVSEIEGQDNAFQVAIMRKEHLILETDSIQRRDQLMAYFRECIEFSGSLPPPSKVPPPPVPQIPNGSLDNPLPPPPPEYQENTPRFNAPPGQFPPLRTSASARAFGPGPAAGAIIPPVRSTSFTGGPPPPNMRGGPPPMNMQGPPYMQQPFPVHPINGQRPGPGPGLPPGPGFPGPGGFPPGQGFPPGPGRPHPGPGMGGFPPNMGPPNGNGLPPRPPSEPMMNGMRKSPSTMSLNSQFSQFENRGPVPPMPPFYGGPHNHSQPSLHAPQARPLLPSAQSAARSVSMVEPSFDEPSPPNSPVQEMPTHTGPVTSSISAQMKCKVFLQQQHAQWKSLGSAKLKLYREDPTNIKQLVVEADNKDKTILISTIVLTDGVERVGKTGVAIELSSNGSRAGIVYMIQLRNEDSAGGLFNSLLAGSDRATGR